MCYVLLVGGCFLIVVCLFVVCCLLLVLLLNACRLIIGVACGCIVCCL